jgi:hypothetical protein
MTPVDLLAACGLLYAILATSPSVQVSEQILATEAVIRICELALKEGQFDDVTSAMWQLSERLKEHPDELVKLAEEIGPTCRLMAGL